MNSPRSRRPPSGRIPAGRRSSESPTDSTPTDPSQASSTEAFPTPEDSILAIGERIIDLCRTEETRRAYTADLRHFLGAFGPRRVQEIGEAELVGYARELAETRAPKTANRRLSFVRRLFARALREGHIDWDPAADIKNQPDEEVRPTYALTKPELRELLNSIDISDMVGLRDRALLGVMARLGLRRSEAASLRVGDLERIGEHWVVQVKGKGGKVRSVKCPLDVRRDIDAWLEASGHTRRWDRPKEAPLFVECKALRWHPTEAYRATGKRSLNGESLRRILMRRAKEAGIDRRLAPHALRATFITLAIEGGAPIEKVQWAVGHSSLRQTLHYHKRRDSLDDAAVDYIHLND